MTDFITDKRSEKFPPDLLRAWATHVGLEFEDERVQFPDECGWPDKFEYFLAGWTARINAIS